MSPARMSPARMSPARMSPAHPWVLRSVVSLVEIVTPFREGANCGDEAGVGKFAALKRLHYTISSPNT